MRQRPPMDQPDIPIAPMIDCVFLMLVYFMTTSSLQKSEADLSCPVGKAGMAADPLPAVDEQSLALAGDGAVLWNGSRFEMLGPGGGRETLAQRLEAFRLTCEAAGSQASLRLSPEEEAPHQALVSFLDAVNRSGIETLHLP